MPATVLADQLDLQTPFTNFDERFPLLLAIAEELMMPSDAKPTLTR